MIELGTQTRFNILKERGFFDFAVSFAIRIEQLQNYVGPVETNSLCFNDLEWKLKFVRYTLPIESDDAVEGLELDLIRCSLLASASRTDDWTCTLNKHVLAWKPFDSPHKMFRNRPSNQFKVAGKKLLEGLAGFFNVSLADDDESKNSNLELSLDEVVQYAGQNKWLICEVYIRGVGPITLYPTYLETYDFGKKKCVMLRLNGKNGESRLFKVPMSRLKKESTFFNNLIQNGSSVFNLEADCDFEDFRQFLQCLLPPYMPLDKCLPEMLKEVTRLATLYDCEALKNRCTEHIVESSEISSCEKIIVGSSCNLPTVVLYALDEMDAEMVRGYAQSDDFKHLNYETQIAVLGRIAECNES